MAKGKKKTKAIRKWSVDFISVFLGVILGLFFNNLNEDRLDRKKIEGLLEKVALGNQKNIDLIDVQLKQNQTVLDSLIYYRDNSELSISEVLSKSKGIRYIQYDLAAWNVLKSSELLIDVDYDLTSLLYLLNESIIYDSNTLEFVPSATDRQSKETLIGNLSDYLNSINHRKVLTEQIRDLLD